MVAEDVQRIVERIEASPAFAAFAKDAREHRLVHIFTTKGDAKPVEVGYYDAGADAITVFSDDEPVLASEAQEVFRSEDGEKKEELAALPRDEIEIGIIAVREKLKEFVDQKHPAHPIAQEILILQQREGVPSWGATLLTHTLHVILVRVDARDGSIISSELRNILELRAPE